MLQVVEVIYMQKIGVVSREKEKQPNCSRVCCGIIEHRVLLN